MPAPSRLVCTLASLLCITACSSEAAPITANDAGVPSDAADALVSTDAGTTFADLARDIFSASGTGRCQNDACHGNAKGAGGLFMKTDLRGMYDGLVAYSSKIYMPRRVLQPVPGGDARTTSSLLKVLDPSKPGGMPKLDLVLGNRKLEAEELARIEAWLARGAPFDE